MPHILLKIIGESRGCHSDDSDRCCRANTGKLGRVHPGRYWVCGRQRGYPRRNIALFREALQQHLRVMREDGQTVPDVTELEIRETVAV